MFLPSDRYSEMHFVMFLVTVSGSFDWRLYRSNCKDVLQRSFRVDLKLESQTLRPWATIFRWFFLFQVPLIENSLEMGVLLYWIHTIQLILEVKWLVEFHLNRLILNGVETQNILWFLHLFTVLTKVTDRFFTMPSVTLVRIVFLFLWGYCIDSRY